MRISKGKRNKTNRGRTKTRLKRDKVNVRGKGRWFLTSKDMAEMKLDEAIAYSAAKRKGKKLAGVYQQPCGCGGEGCSYTISLEDSSASLPKKQKAPTRRQKYSKMVGYKPRDTKIYKRDELET